MEIETIGKKRLEYLDLANKAYATNQIDIMIKYIEAFQYTLKDESVWAKDLTKRFTDAQTKFTNTINQTHAETQTLPLEKQEEARYTGRISAIIEMWKDRLNSCWQISITNNLFAD